VQKTLEFPRIAAIAISAVVAAGAFAITPVTTNTASLRSTTADVALVAYPPCVTEFVGSCLPATATTAYATLFKPFTPAALEWMAQPALNGTWTVAKAAPGDAGAYALQQLANGSWGLFAPTGAAEEELVKLVAAAEGQGWTLQHPSNSDPIPGDPTWIINPPGDLIAGGPLEPKQFIATASIAGVGALTALIANPFPIPRQILNNLAAYAGLFSTMPLEQALATIVATVAAHAQAVTGLAAEILPRALDDMIKRVAAVAMATGKAIKNVLDAAVTDGPVRGVQAFAAGFLGPIGWDGTVASSLPGTLLAATTGPGIQANPAIMINIMPPIVTSVVGEAQAAGARIVNALGGVGGQPVPSCGEEGSLQPCAIAPYPQPAAARSAARSTNVRAAAARAAAATTPAAVDSAADTVADTATASTDTVRKPAGKHRAARSAASRATAS